MLNQKNKKMKKLVLIWAFCGVTAAMPAQVNQDSTNNSGNLNTDKVYPTPDKNKGDDQDPSNKTYQNSNNNNNNANSQNGSINGQSSSDNSYGNSGSLSQSPQEDLSVPEKVRTAFSEAYKNMKAAWKREGQNFKARFKNKNENEETLQTVVVYDKEGNVIRTEKQISSADYPSELAKYYNGKNIDLSNYEVWEVDGKNGTRKYFTKHEGEGDIVWFDNKGRHMTESGNHMAHHKMYK
jgi:hypothetical protein